jgi:hypothetical protein
VAHVEFFQFQRHLDSRFYLKNSTANVNLSLNTFLYFRAVVVCTVKTKTRICSKT